MSASAGCGHAVALGYVREVSIAELTHRSKKPHHSISVGTREQHGRRYGTTSTIFRSTSAS
jgi:hypothetical protein